MITGIYSPIFYQTFDYKLSECLNPSHSKHGSW